MRKYLIKVNGTAYEVEVEEAIGGVFTPVSATTPIQAAPAAAAVASASATVSAAAPVTATPAAATGQHLVKAPMPGTILKISVTVGETVKKNQVLCVLEAMKMENEIVAPQDGVVAGVHVAKGSSVQAGDTLVSLN